MPNPAVDTAPGDVTAPSAPTFTITPYGRGVMLTIVLAEPSDFAYYEVHKGLSAGAMSLFAQGRSTQVPDTAAAYGTSYFYKVRAVDTSGNASAFSSTLSTAPTTWATADMTSNAITQLNWVVTSAADVKDISSPISNLASTLAAITSIGGPILVTFNGTFNLKNNHGANVLGLVMSMTRNGATIITAQEIGYCPAVGSPGDSQWLHVNMSIIDLPSAGPNTYRIAWAVNGGVAGDAVSALERSMYCMELKR